MLRQMAVAAVVVLLGQRPVAVQMLVIIAVIAVAFAAQIIIQPFKTMVSNGTTVWRVAPPILGCYR